MAVFFISSITFFWFQKDTWTIVVLVRASPPTLRRWRMHGTWLSDRWITSRPPLIWTNAATPRCKHFLWLLHRERLPSAAMLHRRNIVDNSSCAYCGAYEDQDHLLLRCPKARRIWQLLNWPRLLPGPLGDAAVLRCRRQDCLHGALVEHMEVPERLAVGPPPPRARVRHQRINCRPATLGEQIASANEADFIGEIAANFVT